MKTISALLVSLLAALTLVVGAVALAPPASAVAASGHAYGFTWRGDNRSWLGSHRLADGNVGLCLELTKRAPEGDDLLYRRADTDGRYSPDDTARLAYLARNWASTTDPDWAAAAQLETWEITGMGGHTRAWASQRANDHQVTVELIANQMRQAMDAFDGASRGVTATIALEQTAGSPSAVRTDLLVDFITGGVRTLPPGLHSGTVTLKGAVFADGSATAELRNGDRASITPTGTGSEVTVSAQVSYSNLPYGSAFWEGDNSHGGQSLLVPPAGLARASAETDGSGISPLPFAPQVTTQVSDQVAGVGAAIHDSLSVGIASHDGEPEVPASGTEGTSGATRLTEWGVFRAGDGALHPVPVTVRSTLLGPFDVQPTPTPSVPSGAPTVCAVTTLADHGPGLYETPECVLPSPGYYVWVDRIDPDDTPAEQGGDRLEGWASGFGDAHETTLVAAPPSSTPTPTPTPTTPAVVPPPTSPPGVTTAARTHPSGALASTGRELSPLTVPAGGLLAAGLATAAVGLALGRWARRRV